MPTLFKLQLLGSKGYSHLTQKPSHHLLFVIYMRICSVHTKNCSLQSKIVLWRFKDISGEKIFMTTYKNLSFINESSALRSKSLEYMNKQMCYFFKVATKLLNGGLLSGIRILNWKTTFIKRYKSTTRF